MYKVYILDNKLSINEMPFNKEASPSAVVFDSPNLDLTKMLKILQSSKSLKKISTSEAKKVDLNRCSLLYLVEAAGGVVAKDEKILMIHRNGKWDLPKGKLEKRERIEDCALREVEEECGVEGLRLGELILQSLHAYNMYDKNVLKRTWWYRMECNDNTPLTPQIEEGITELSWLDKEQVDKALEQSYQTIIDVIEAYRETNR